MVELWGHSLKEQQSTPKFILCTAAMAVAYDGIFVLRQILTQREQELETQSTKNNIVEQLYSQSPLNYDKLALHSYSLELQQRFTQMPSTYIDPTTDYKGHDDETKVIRHGTLISRFDFEKEEVREAITASILSALLTGGSDARGGVMQPMQNGGEWKMLKIWLPGIADSLRIRVRPYLTIEELIKITLKQYELQSKDDISKVRLNNNPKSYIVRFAEEDGTPEDGLPAPGRQQQILQFKFCETYALVKDPNFKEQEAVQEFSGPRLFKVFLPNESGFISVMYNDSMTLQELRETVCTKRRLELHHNSYGFHYKGDPEWLSLDKKLSELDIQTNNNNDNEAQTFSLVLEEKKKGSLSRKVTNRNLEEEGDAPRKITQIAGPIFFYTQSRAKRYEQFTVSKLNKFGQRQSRTLGIDAEQIIVSHSEKGRRWTLRLTDVANIRTIPNRPNHFLIETNDKKVLKYETPQADRIVSKIDFLKKSN